MTKMAIFSALAGMLGIAGALVGCGGESPQDTTSKAEQALEQGNPASSIQWVNAETGEERAAPSPQDAVFSCSTSFGNSCRGAQIGTKHRNGVEVCIYARADACRRRDGSETGTRVWGSTDPNAGYECWGDISNTDGTLNCT